MFVYDAPSPPRTSRQPNKPSSRSVRAARRSTRSRRAVCGEGRRKYERAALRCLRRYLDESDPSLLDVAQLASLLVERASDARQLVEVAGGAAILTSLRRHDSRNAIRPTRERCHKPPPASR